MIPPVDIAGAVWVALFWANCWANEGETEAASTIAAQADTKVRVLMVSSLINWALPGGHMAHPGDWHKRGFGGPTDTAAAALTRARLATISQWR